MVVEESGWKRRLPWAVRREVTVLLVLLIALQGWALGQDGPRAYRDIHFGMSEEEVVKAVTSDHAFIRPWTGLSYEECHKNRQPTDLSFCDYPEMWFWTNVFTRVAGVVVEVSFFYDADDRLYRVLLAVDEDRSAAFFETLVRDEAQLLASVMTRSRGESSWTRSLSILDMDAGYIKYSQMWPADGSGVVHAVGVGEKQSTFYAALDITWESLAESVRREEGDVLDSQIEEASEDF